MRHNRLDHLSTDELERLIGQYIHNQRNREIVKQRFVNGVKFEDLADRFELSVPQVKTIVYNSEQIIFNHI